MRQRLAPASTAVAAQAGGGAGGGGTAAWRFMEMVRGIKKCPACQASSPPPRFAICQPPDLPSPGAGQPLSTR